VLQVSGRGEPSRLRAVRLQFVVGVEALALEHRAGCGQNSSFVHHRPRRVDAVGVKVAFQR